MALYGAARHTDEPALTDTPTWNVYSLNAGGILVASPMLASDTVSSALTEKLIETGDGESRLSFH